MAYQQKDFSALQKFIPDVCFDDIFNYIKQYHIQLTITPQRKSIHGNYKHNFITKSTAITINGTLNKYAFLITLIHEIAHCICMNTNGRNALPHGQEWQNIYAKLLIQFTEKNIFPQDILYQLQNTIQSPKASSCADPALEKILVKYNANAADTIITYVEDLLPNELFSTPEGKIFSITEKRRTRYLCTELQTGKRYLFPAIYQIKRLEQ